MEVVTIMFLDSVPHLKMHVTTSTSHTIGLKHNYTEEKKFINYKKILIMFIVIIDKKYLSPSPLFHFDLRFNILRNLENDDITFTLF